MHCFRLVWNFVNNYEILLENRRPFLDLLLEARVDDKELNQNDIREEVNTFMFEVSIL